MFRNHPIADLFSPNGQVDVKPPRWTYRQLDSELTRAMGRRAVYERRRRALLLGALVCFAIAAGTLAYVIWSW